MPIRAIIVEDEPEGMKVLEIKIKENCTGVEIIDKCTTVDAAVRSIDRQNPDLVFLDVRLHKRSGFEVLKRLPMVDFEVIFVTGYDQYAVDAFKVNALDFLLKPVDVEELKAAVNKAKAKIGQVEKKTRILVPVSNGYQIIPIKHIIYCRSDDNFTRMFLEGEERFVHIPRNLKEVGLKLPDQQFFRIHRQSIVNLLFVKAYQRTAGGSVIMQNGDELAIARDKKEEFLQRLMEL